MNKKIWFAVMFFLIIVISWGLVRYLKNDNDSNLKKITVSEPTLT